MPIDRARILAHGWRQGRLFTPEDSARLIGTVSPPPYLPRELHDGFRLIVASHSCDVVCERDDEPHVDVYPVIPLPGQADPLQLAVRNARRLHLQLSVSGVELPCELIAASRFCLPRSLLAELSPDSSASLAELYLNHFVAWLASRFDRPAFPDEFNARLDPAKKKIRKALNDAHRSLRAVLIDIEPFDESPQAEGTAYEIWLLGLMRDHDHQNDTERDRVIAALARIKQALESCVLGGKAKAFRVNPPEVRSDSALSVADYGGYYNFGFDDLSLRDNTGTPTQVL